MRLYAGLVPVISTLREDVLYLSKAVANISNCHETGE